MPESSVLFKWLGQGLVLLRFAARVCNHFFLLRNRVVHRDNVEASHDKVAGNLVFVNHLWLVLLQAVLDHRLVSPWFWRFEGQLLVVLELPPQPQNCGLVCDLAD